MAKKKKTNWKAIGIGFAALLVIGAVGSLFDSGSPEPSPAPERVVVTAAPSAKPTVSPEPTATPYRIHGMDPQRTVYVSASGLIHLKNDCSGMKNYTEMTLEQADAAGYEYCERCAK